MGLEREPFFESLSAHLTSNTIDTVSIGGRLVGKDQPVYVIAEVGANHRGEIANALRAIEAAAAAGADAVKFQHLTHDKIAADTVIYDEWHGKEIGKLSNFYKDAELPYEWTDRLIAHAKKNGITFLSTPFDKDAVDLLDMAGVPAFKVASYELTDDLLLRYIAQKGKPVIISTGMAYLEEVAHAVRVIQEEGNNQIVVLHCVSMYPPKQFSDLNLRSISSMREALKVPIGYSDHSEPPYLAAPIVAVGLGACVIEKHLTDSRSGGSNDDANSVEVEEFKRIVEEIRFAQGSLGDGIKQPVSYPDHKGDEVSDRFTRRSIYALRDIAEGETVTSEMIITLRPWGGIEPKNWGIIEGRKTTRAIKARSALTFDDFFVQYHAE